MIRKYSAFFILTVFACFIFIKCRKQSIASPLPSIKYAGYEKVQYPGTDFDSAVFVKIDFEDGDGDLGLAPNDTGYPFKLFDPYYYNVFVEYLEHVNGVYSYRTVGTDTINYNDRILNLQPDSRNKSISGTLTIKLIPIIGTVVPDSVKVNVFVIDKALHKSNVVSSGAIPVKF